MKVIINYISTSVLQDGSKKCDKCPKTFDSETELQTHKKNVHNPVSG